MSVSRTSLVRGPSKNTFNGASFFSKDDFNISLNKETFEINTSAHGKVDERAIEISAEATLTPEGRWTQALVDAIYNPFANMVVGTSILTATDKPLVCSASDGQIHTLTCAGITKLPDLTLSAKKTMVGSMTLKGFRGVGKLWSDANSIYSVATTGGSITDATFDPQAIRTQPYTAVWGTVAGFTTPFDTEDGWTISFDLKTQEIPVDSQGNLDLTFVSLSVMAKCVPIGPTASELLAAARLQGTGVNRGYSLQSNGSGGTAADLVITGQDTTTIATLKAANIKTAGYQFGATKLRVGEIGFVASRTFTTGAQNALFTLAV